MMSTWRVRLRLGVGVPLLREQCRRGVTLATAGGDAGRYAPDRDAGRYAPDRDAGRYAPDRDAGRYAPDRDAGRYAPDRDAGRYAPDRSAGRYAPDRADRSGAASGFAPHGLTRPSRIA
jgi:hypothetical protein